MKDLSLEERRAILLDHQIMKSSEVKAKWGISQNTLTHILFFHGPSSAKARGYYYKDLLAGAVHPIVEKIRVLKSADHSSLEVSQLLGINLEVVNKNW